MGTLLPQMLRSQTGRGRVCQSNPEPCFRGWLALKPKDVIEVRKDTALVEQGGARASVHPPASKSFLCIESLLRT